MHLVGGWVHFGPPSHFSHLCSLVIWSSLHTAQVGCSALHILETWPYLQQYPQRVSLPRELYFASLQILLKRMKWSVPMRVLGFAFLAPSSQAKHITMDECCLFALASGLESHRGIWARVKLGYATFSSDASMFPPSCPSPIEVGIPCTMYFAQGWLTLIVAALRFMFCRAFRISFLYAYTEEAGVSKGVSQTRLFLFVFRTRMTFKLVDLRTSFIVSLILLIGGISGRAPSISTTNSRSTLL